MEGPLEAVNRQIQQENDRHKRIIDDLNKKKTSENTQHEQTMRMYNSRKEQIKRTQKTLECKLNDRLHKKYATLDEMYALIKKATADFI